MDKTVLAFTIFYNIRLDESKVIELELSFYNEARGPEVKTDLKDSTNFIFFI